MLQKIVSLKKAAEIRQTLKKKRKKVVFTNGCFDILHYGHVSYLQAARKMGDFLIVGLNSDCSIKKIKGPDRPINQEKHRAGVLAALECVDLVIIFKDDTPQKLIETLLPDVLAKGSDWEKNKIVGADAVEGNGGKVRRIRLQPRLSTTNTISKIRKQSS